MSIWRWAQHFEPIPETSRIDLGEGDTPLIRSRKIGPEAGLNELHFKLESTNPTGSYKDRFAAAAVSDIRARGEKRCVATSSGNTGAALAAYCAAAGVRCQIAIVETAPEDKLRQMLAYGADLFRVKGFGLDPAVTASTFETLNEVAAAPEASLQISAFKYSPVGMSGVRSISFELVEQLPLVKHVFCPAGGGGLTLAVAQGFQIARDQNPTTAAPAVHCAQPEGNDTIATPLRNGDDQARDVQCASAISGLQVANVIDGHEVIVACRASGGTGHTVSDQEIWDTQRQLAIEEGIFAEPAGAVALAAALKARAAGEINANEPTVCLITGSGFKDASSVDRMTSSRKVPLVEAADLAASLSPSSRPCA